MAGAMQLRCSCRLWHLRLMWLCMYSREQAGGGAARLVGFAGVVSALTRSECEDDIEAGE